MRENITKNIRVSYIITCGRIGIIIQKYIPSYMYLVNKKGNAQKDKKNYNKKAFHLCKTFVVVNNWV